MVDDLEATQQPLEQAGAVITQAISPTPTGTMLYARHADGVGQIKASHWSKGRFAMVGDAAYCPAPITGKGTTLAFVGACELAGELATHAHYAEGLASYERIMRPYTESVQQLPPPGVPRLAYPKTAFGVSVVNTVVGILASAPVQKIASVFGSSEAEKEDLLEGTPLPEYAL